MDAAQFVDKLKTYQSDKEYEKIRRYFKRDDTENRVIGVRMKQVFDLAKTNSDMSLEEINKLLDSPYYEARMGAYSIMDFQVQKKSTTGEHRKKLFELYLKRHDRINSWDYVDRSAPRVVGKYLYDFEKKRDVLYQMARSGSIWERRTAITATAWFIRQHQLDDTFAIAEILVDDPEELIQKAVGTWLREAGKKNPEKLQRFLEKHAGVMPRPMLNNAIEKLEPDQKAYYRKL